MRRSFVRLASTMVVAILSVVAVPSAGAQGVTTGALAGSVNDAAAAGRPDVRVVAVHVPSGTTYEARTRADGRFTLPGMRVGGPYRVTATAIGFEADVREDVFVNLGQTTDLRFTMREAAVQLGQNGRGYVGATGGPARPSHDLWPHRGFCAAHAAIRRRVVIRRSGQPSQQHHGRRLLLQ